MEYKIIFTDLDDTLLNSQKKISNVDKTAIMKAQEKGVKFVLASGRPTPAMWDLANELELDKYGSFILSFNGSLVTDCKSSKLIFDERLTISDTHLLYDFAKENGVHIITYIDDEIISEIQSEYIDVEVEITKLPFRKVSDFKSSVTHSPVKCMLLAEPTYLKGVEEKLKEKYGDRFSIAISKPFFLEVTKKGIDKGTALKKLVHYLGLDISQSIAIGDSYNDIPMLESAGLAVCVENAKEDIIKICDYVTKSNDEGGMAHMIEKFILNS